MPNIPDIDFDDAYDKVMFIDDVPTDDPYDKPWDPFDVTYRPTRGEIASDRADILAALEQRRARYGGQG